MMALTRLAKQGAQVGGLENDAQPHDDDFNFDSDRDVEAGAARAERAAGDPILLPSSSSSSSSSSSPSSSPPL